MRREGPALSFLPFNLFATSIVTLLAVLCVPSGSPARSEETTERQRLQAAKSEWDAEKQVRIEVAGHGFEVGIARAFSELSVEDRRSAKKAGYGKKDRVWFRPAAYPGWSWVIVPVDEAADGPHYEVVTIRFVVDQKDGRTEWFHIVSARVELPEHVVEAARDIGYESVEDIRFRFDESARELVLLKPQVSDVGDGQR